MPTKRSRSSSRSKTASRSSTAAAIAADITRHSSTADALVSGEPGAFTGRYLVLLTEDDTKANLQRLKNAGGLSVAASSDFGDDQTVDMLSLDGSDGIFLEEIGVAVVDGPPDSLSGLSAAVADSNQPEVLAMEPERICETSGNVELLAALRAFAAGAQAAYEHALVASGGSSEAAEFALQDFADSSSHTWGLLATRVDRSAHAGHGIKVAVLDTGFDVSHPDFAGRRIVTKSFLNQPIQDVQGHGTHCIGTACGSLRPGVGPRYGVAHGATIYAGKVLGDDGRGGDGGILAGINWAVREGCQVVSMSLGAPSFPGQRYNEVFEQTARRALTAGTLIIAAAGNNSRRPGTISPVTHPANCPSIMAVAAVDEALNVAGFSCGTYNPDGGKVDLCAPGVNVRSSWPAPLRYRSIQGTSMATPHVAGIAALFAESDPNLRGRALWTALLQHVRPLNQPARDVGAGLVQAP